MDNQKFKFNLGQVLKAVIGLLIIFFAVANNGLYPPVSEEIIGYDTLTLALIVLGGWFMYSAYKSWKK